MTFSKDITVIFNVLYLPNQGIYLLTTQFIFSNTRWCTGSFTNLFWFGGCRDNDGVLQILHLLLNIFSIFNQGQICSAVVCQIESLNLILPMELLCHHSPLIVLSSIHVGSNWNDDSVVVVVVVSIVVVAVVFLLGLGALTSEVTFLMAVVTPKLRCCLFFRSQNICSLRTTSASLCSRRGGPNVCSLQQEDCLFFNVCRLLE